MSIKAARDRLDEARRKLASGIYPADERRSNGATPTDGAPSNTFEAIAREWFAKHSPAWAPGHGYKIIRRLETNIFPWLKQDSIRDIKPLELLTVIQRALNNAGATRLRTAPSRIAAGYSGMPSPLDALTATSLAI